jgi:methylenetetrahydrofolate reductase (NADPH)
MSVVSAYAYRPDQKLTEVLAQRNFTFSAEVIPPRNGAEQAKVLNQIDQLISAGAQFLSVTKGAGGSLRGGSLPIAQTIKERFGVTCIAHFTCRDITVHDVENQLIDHHYFGIRNILALRGDPPQGQPDWKPREGGHNYAYQLIEQIRQLNQGKYLVRPGGPPAEGNEKTDFCIGAAVYPEHPNEEERLRFFKLKVEAGAEYGITDMLFDPEAYARFRELCEKNGVSVPILPGTRLLKTQTQARKMAERFRVSVPTELIRRLPETDADPAAAMEAGIEGLVSLSDKLKSYGAPGIHVYVISDTAGACAALRKLRI